MHSETSFGDVESVVAPIDVDPPAGELRRIDPLERPSAGLQLGPRWHSVLDAWTDQHVAGGSIGLGDRYRSEQDAWFAHPALLDVATAFGVALGDRDDALYVPVGYDSVARLNPLPDRLHVRATRLDDSTDELLRVDVVVADESGVVAMKLGGLALRPIDDAAALGAPDLADRHAGQAHHISPLLALAMDHGIRADEGAELLGRFLGTGSPASHRLQSRCRHAG